jgi:hypothetical protein
VDISISKLRRGDKERRGTWKMVTEERVEGRRRQNSGGAKREVEIVKE